MNQRQLLPVRAFAAFMNVSPHTVWRWAREGRISLYGVGRPVVDVDEALEALRRTPAPAPVSIRGGRFERLDWSPSGQAGRPRGQRINRKPA